MKKQKRVVSMRLLVPCVVAAGMILLAAVLIVRDFVSQKQNILNATAITARSMMEEINLSIKSPIVPAQLALQLLSHNPVTRAMDIEERVESMPVLAELLSNSPLSEAIYVGYQTGELLLLAKARDYKARHLPKMPAGAAFILVTKTLGTATAFSTEVRIYDESLVLLELHTVTDTEITDPRTTEWFQKALTSDQVIITRPHAAVDIEGLGITIAARAELAPAVIGIWVTINDFCHLLASLPITPHTQIAIVDEEKDILAYQDVAHLDRIFQQTGTVPNVSSFQVPVLEHLLAQSQHQNDISLLREGATSWYSVVSPLVTDVGGSFTILIAIPADELLGGVWQNMYSQIRLACGIVLVFVLLGFVLSWWMLRPLPVLAAQVQALANFDVNQPIGVSTRLREVRDLGLAFAGMATTIKHFLQVSMVLNREQDIERMLHLVLEQLLSILHLEQGAIYLYDERSGHLRLSVQQGQPYAPSIHLGTEGLEDSALEAHVTKSVGREQIVVPLRSRDTQLVGVLAIRSSLAPDNKWRGAFDTFLRQVSASAAVAIETRQLVLAQRELLQGIIKLVADAIDTKSRYTGGHCRRVPELAIMLMDEIQRSTHAEFAGFSMSRAEAEEFRIAAWLHDCGKITTPEYIVDKATKLENIYNRLHEIRTRFEVLHRDAYITFLEAVAAGANKEQAWQECQAKQQQLQEDYSFVAQCNIGGESMPQEYVERLERIAGQEWLRHFDDRIGLSREELVRKEASGTAPSLPAKEYLLADRPEHIIAWGDHLPPVQKGDPHNYWHFDMEIPPYMFNYGELYNLSVRKGTLTAEDRFKINEHIVETIRMLSALPFPKYLRNVPTIAGTHHEHMDGTGYPCRKTRAQMSIPERVMAIADVFEALTAGDRPYKRAKKLSETLHLMQKMVTRQHLDASVFNFFLSSGVYLEYAREFMDPHFVDIENVESFFVSEEPVAQE